MVTRVRNSVNMLLVYSFLCWVIELTEAPKISLWRETLQLFLMQKVLCLVIFFATSFESSHWAYCNSYSCSKCDTVEKPAETQTSIRLASHLVRALNWVYRTVQHVRKLASWFCHYILYSWWGEGCSQERQGAPTELPLASWSRLGA
jgi:hypothetical protein